MSASGPVSCSFRSLHAPFASLLLFFTSFSSDPFILWASVKYEDDYFGQWFGSLTVIFGVFF